MQGSKRFRSGAWRLQVYGGRDPDTGRHLRLSRTVHAPDTRAGAKLADAELRRFVDEVEAGQYRTRVDSPSIAELLDRWTAARQGDWSVTTANTYRLLIAAQIVPALGDLQVRDVRARHLDRFYADLADHGARDGSPLAPASVRKCHTILSAALKQACKWGIIAVNPASLATPPKVPPSRVVDATADEVRAVLAAAAEVDPDFAVFVWLAAVTGARRSQVLGLRWTDVDLERGEIVLERGIVDGGPGVGLAEKGTKSGQVARNALDGATVALLRAYRARCELARVEAGLPGPVRLFERPTGEPWRPDTTSDRWVRVRDLAGVRPNLRLHSVRHYVVTALLGSGMDPANVAEFVAHANPNVTLAVYAHASPVRNREAAELLGAALREPEPGI